MLGGKDSVATNILLLTPYHIQADSLPTTQSRVVDRNTRHKGVRLSTIDGSPSLRGLSSRY